MALGDRLRYERKKRSWTLEDTARRLGIKSLNTYANWEYGRTEPDVETLANIADLYDVSLDYLLSGDNNGEQMQLEMKEPVPALDYEIEYRHLLDESGKLKEQNKLLKQVIKNLVEIDL